MEKGLGEVLGRGGSRFNKHAQDFEDISLLPLRLNNSIPLLAAAAAAVLVVGDAFIVNAVTNC